MTSDDTATQSGAAMSLAKQEALMTAGMNLALRKQKEKDEQQTMEAFKKTLLKYSPQKGEKPLVHMDRLRHELLQRNNNITDLSSEVVDIIQSTLKVTQEHEDRLEKANKKTKDVEETLQNTMDERDHDIHEIEELEDKVDTQKDRIGLQARELAFLRKGFVASCFCMVWLACVLSLGPFQLHLAAAAVSAGVLSVAFMLHNDSSISKMVSTVKGTAIKIRRVLNGEEKEEEDDSLLPADKLTGASPSQESPPASPRSPSATTANGNLRHRTPSSATRNLSFESRIVAFYQKWAPEKLQDEGFAMRTAAKYSYPGGEEKLFATLVEKYGPEPKRLGNAKASVATNAAPTTPAARTAAGSLPRGGSGSGKKGGGKQEDGLTKALSLLEARLTRFYSKWAPSKLSDPSFAARTATKYVDPEATKALFKTLTSKYGPEPEVPKCK